VLAKQVQDGVKREEIGMTLAATLKRYLEDRGVDYARVPHPHTGSSHETALAAHVPDDHIAKAVVLRDDAGYLLVVVPASHWLKIDAINRELGRDLQLAREDELATLFSDCRPGAIPPLGAAYGIDTLLDESLTSLASVYFEAGDHEQLVHVHGADFQTLLAGARHGHYSHQS
jgi:Ala-tRNA(Pro) deacylase